MTTITINYREYTITEALYAQIESMVMSQKICRKCNQPYTNENPEAGKNICLQDIVKQEPYFIYVQQEVRQLDQPENERKTYYLFKCTSERYKDYIAVSNKYTERSLEVNLDETLRYYGFAFPESVTIGEKEQRFYQEFNIVGNPTTSNLVIISNSVTYYDWNAKATSINKRFQYIAIKGKGYKLLNKRLGIVRDAYKKVYAEMGKPEKYMSSYKHDEAVTKLLPLDINLY